MSIDGHDFLNKLASFPNRTFERTFSKTATRLGLASLLEPHELKLLFQAAFCAALCNIAINGLGGCDGKIKPERETNRLRLEQEFMAARTRFCSSTGWRALSSAKRTSLTRIFLTVRVEETNLAA